MASHLVREALIDLQTIAIVGLLYGLFREEEANAFLRTWLSNNFPLGVYLLAPLTVAAISGTLVVITIARIIFFVKGEGAALRVGEVHPRLNMLEKQLREFASFRRPNPPAVMLSIFGVALTLYSYFVSVVPLEALGISCIILGITAVSLPRNISGGSGLRAMLQGATLSVEALLDQHVVQRATYLPPVEDGVVTAYVPLSPETATLSQSEMRMAPKSLVGNNQKGLLLYPVGSELGSLPEFQDGLSLEERLRYVLVESANICSQVMAEETGSLIIVGLKGADLNIQGQRYLASLGSLPSSLAACVIAALHNKPVTLLEERRTSDRLTAIFRLLA